MDRRAAAFETLFQRHVGWVVHQARLVVGERDAEDVAQEVFLRLYQAQARGEFDASASPLGWLRIATYRAARDRRRCLVREQPAADDHAINPVDEALMSDTERAMAVRERWAVVLELVDTLEPERRIVFVMAEIDQMTLAEIAAVLELSPNTVSTRLRLARADFDAALSRKRAEERRKLRGAGALLLPLGADALLRMARVLPRPSVSSSTQARIWEGIQHELRRLDGVDIVPRRSRLVSEASKLSTFVLGTMVGILAAAALGDTCAGRREAGDPPSEPVTLHAVFVVPPAVVAGAPVPPVSGTSSQQPSTSPPDTGFAELSLVKGAQAALEAHDPERALLLLDLYAQRYPRSRRFEEVIAQLRRDAQRIAEQRQQRP